MEMVILLIGSIGMIVCLIQAIIQRLRNFTIKKSTIGLFAMFFVLSFCGMNLSFDSNERKERMSAYVPAENQNTNVYEEELKAKREKEAAEREADQEREAAANAAQKEKEEAENDSKNQKIIETEAVNRSISEIIQLYEGKTAAYDVLNDKHLILTAYVKDTHIGDSGPYIYIDAKNMKSFLGSKVKFRPSVTSEAVSELSKGQKIVLDGIAYTKGAVFELRYATILSVDEQEIDENNIVIPEITYKQIDLQTMLNDLKENAMRAEKNYQNEYIQFTGKIDVIDSDGRYISVEPVSSTLSLLNSVHCSLKTDDQRNVIMYKNKGDQVTIKGKVTSIGEILGYSVDIDEIS